MSKNGIENINLPYRESGRADSNIVRKAFFGRAC
jgi:hypothetical protein